MSSKTKIVVLRMKEIIYTAIFVGLAILLVTLCFIMFRPKKDTAAVSAQAAAYVPGVYSAALTLGSENVNVEVTVDKDRINSIDLVPLSEAVTTMYPLMQPTLDDLALMKQTADILMPVKHLLPDNFHIGINVSAGCFLAAGFEKECLNLVKKLGNDKIKLVLELTERNPIPVTPEARAIFDSLHQHNITFALDDFGTGYATYRYLQAFPVDFIKIDKSFVQMASVDEISGHIVDNIVELARKLGLSIVAEGVETQEQADLMIGKGVHFLQGYLYSPPVPGNKFISEWVMKAGG